MDDMKKNVAWNTFGSVFYCVCQWLITILVVWLDSYGTAGKLSLAMTTSSSFSAISLFSMRNYQVSDLKGEYSAGQYVSSRIITCIGAVLSCVAVSMFGNNTFYEVLCITAFMIVRVAEAIVDVLHGIDQKYVRYDLIGKSYIIRGIFTIASFSLGMWLIKDLLITLMIMAGLNLLTAIGYDWIQTGKLEEFQINLMDQKIIKLLAACGPIVIYSFLLSLENLIPKTLLKEMYGEEQLGIYSSMASPTLVVQVFASVAFNPFLPAFSLAYQQGEIKRFRNMFHKALAVLGAMCVLVTLGGMLLGRWGLRILFGPDILEHYYLFLPIVWCTILTALIWILSSLVVALRKIKWLLAGMAADFLLCVLAVEPIVNRYEKNGVSIVQIGAYVLYIIYLIVICEASTRKRKENK
ncbi:MAG: lipopolysaccharide biosynthesis protein [Lachnospiraceae bacterium]|nr:lipopolysaccharide biosynthesis protein [Lachnospiraceae bacterium]